MQLSVIGFFSDLIQGLEHRIPGGFSSDTVLSLSLCQEACVLQEGKEIYKMTVLLLT